VTAFKASTAVRMQRYRARRAFERITRKALRLGVPADELADLVGFINSGVQMRFHPRPGRPRNVTESRYIMDSWIDPAEQCEALRRVA
jgi:hypothetical protein